MRTNGTTDPTRKRSGGPHRRTVGASCESDRVSTQLAFEDYLSAIETQAARLAEDAKETGQDAKVPSCPGWTVGDLVGHVGIVHRWARANVQGNQSPERAARIHEALTTTPPGAADRLAWFREGAELVVEFLANPPAPRAFWARRQAHETTVHRVDALAARLGHRPTAAQLDLSTNFALDGLDELLTGFLPRSSSNLRSEEPFRVTVAPSDAHRAWTVLVSPDPPVTVAEADPAANTVLTGTAAGLYLSLWNRIDEVAETGHEDIVGLWRDKVRISWR